MKPKAYKKDIVRVLSEAKLLDMIAKAQAMLRELELEVMNFFLNRPDKRTYKD